MTPPSTAAARTLPDAEPDGGLSEREAFFDCTFIWAPREMTGDQPYVIFEDGKSESFTRTLILAVRGEDNCRGVINSAAEVPSDPDVLVICEAPVWQRNCVALNRAGVRGARALAVLYFDVDPSGYWDFAKGCGDSLAEIFHDGGVDATSIAGVAEFLEMWTGARPSNGRIVPLSRFYTRDFLPLQIEKGEAIARVMAAMADDESRAHYARILFGTAEQVFTAFTQQVFGPQQYMEIVEPKPGDVILNCGVGRGWEIPYFLCRMKGEGAIHNIDPNMQFASTPYGDFIESFPDVVVNHPIIAGDQDGELSFAMTDGGMIVSDATRDTNAADDERTTYTCRKIDTLMEQGLADRLDYLKMDVEGGELSILRGAIGAIKKYRPKLAVAIYHEPHHFWEYPAYLLDELEDYRFYVRQYGYSRFETLLYAVPAEATLTASGGERLRRGPTTRKTAEGAGDPLVVAYFRDAPDAARQFYAGTPRTVARLFGVDWETAEITPIPQVEADRLCGVVETPDGAVLVTMHEQEPGKMSVIAGVSPSPTSLKWVASRGVAPDAACAVAAGPDGKARIVLQDPGSNTAAMYALKGGDLSHERAFVLHDTPLAAWMTGRELHMICRSADDGRPLKAVLSPSAEGVALSETSLPSGTFEGLVTLKRNGAAGPEYSRGYAMREGDTVQIYEADGDGYAPVTGIAWDERFMLAPTLVAAPYAGDQ